MNILYYSPGQKATIYLETKDGYQRISSPELPILEFLYLPDGTKSKDYPESLTLLEDGIYYINIVLPSGGTSVGSYLADIKYVHPTTLEIMHELTHIIVTAPYGIYSAG